MGSRAGLLAARRPGRASGLRQGPSGEDADWQRHHGECDSPGSQSVTLSLWIKPDTSRGRHGLIGKRWAGTAAPFVLSLWDGRLEFEATDEKGRWSFNFRSPAVVKAAAWTHVAAEMLFAPTSRSRAGHGDAHAFVESAGWRAARCQSDGIIHPAQEMRAFLWPSLASGKTVRNSLSTHAGLESCRQTTSLSGPVPVTISEEPLGRCSAHRSGRA